MINSFDIETFKTNEKLIPYCVCSIIENNTQTFFGENCIEKFIENLIEINIKKKKDKKKKIKLFSHNLTFDGSLIIQTFDKENAPKIKGIFFKGSIYQLILCFPETELEFKCSLKFFPTKLENANKLLDTNKKIEFTHEKINKDNFQKYQKEIEKYCINDAVIVIQILKKYNNLLSLFNKNWIDETFSLPGISIAVFKEKFNIKKMPTTTHVKEDETFRPSYFGGRCEIFGNPKVDEKIYHFDFTGMYAQVMKENFNYGGYEKILNVNNIEKNGFYEIEGFCKNIIPILPFRQKSNSKLTFPNGYINGLFWWEEILLFKENGGIVTNIKYWLKIKNEGKIFEDFIQTFTDLRKTNKDNNSICKFIINSIYGRLGMKKPNSTTRIMGQEEFENFYKKNKHRILKENWINNLKIVEYKNKTKKETINSNVMIASTITAKARIKLYRALQSILKNNGRLLYSDTDSIFAAFDRNVDNQKFDEVFFDCNKKDTKIKKALFAIPKAYSIIYENNESVTKIKGFNNININFNQFEKTFHSNKKIKIKINALKKQNYIISSESIEKTLDLGEYNKRTFNLDKTSTTPLYLMENGEFALRNRLHDEKQKQDNNNT